MAEQLELDLDPKKFIASTEEMKKATLELGEKIEDSLGKKAPKDIQKLEDAAEKGSNKISGYFRNLGQRIKEDLKTAFDVGKLLGGIKIADEIAHGTKQVLDMERAFDRLNTRLKLSGRELQDFKTKVGSRVAGTGQSLESVLPGVETVAAKGNIKSPEQLADIAGALGQAKGATGENVEGLAETITEILRTQGKKITAKNFKETLDAIQGTRVAGAFGSAGDAAAGIHGISSILSPEQQKRLGLGTREMGGLAAMASKSGEGGQAILQKILETATKAGGQQQLNAIFGTQLFKGGKLNMAALGGINKKGLGQHSEQVMAEATGAGQADLARFIDSMRDNMGDLKKVTSGANETADQFATATDNLASKLDRFKEAAHEAGREVGESFAVLGKDIISGHMGAILGDVKGVGKAAMDNKGSLLATLGIAGLGALAAGSGAKGLLKKVPGLGGALGGLAGGEAAKAMGVTPVYVVNAAEIGGGSGAAGLLTGAGGKLAKFGSLAGSAGLLGVGAAAGGAAGMGIANTDIGKKAFDSTMTGMLFDALFKHLPTKGGYSVADAQKQLDEAMLKSAVREGTHEGMVKAKGAQKPTYTNPSTPSGSGRTM